jgi:23S rRNA G2069 N7-methylase RlmK/C1962 C5-methylase RlmI
MSPKEFQKHIKAGAMKASRRLRLIHQGTTPHDIPASLDFPESRYLKAWVLEG